MTLSAGDRTAASDGPATPSGDPDASGDQDGSESHSIYVVDPGIRRVFGFEPILLRRILRLGVPVIIGMLTQTAINLIDTAMVGRLPERLAVAGTAALGPSLILLWLFGGFLSAIQVGTQAMTARRFGEGDSEAAGRVLANSAALALTSSVVVTAIAIPLAGPIFQFISHDALVREVGTNYSQIRFLGIFSMVGMMSFKAFYDGIGRVRIHMTIAIFMNLANALLNYALIYGNWGAPKLEVDGAAWASIISSIGGLIAMLLWSQRKDDRKLFRAFRVRNLNGKIAWGVAKLSLWSGLATMFVMTGFGLFFGIVGKIDEIEGLAGVNTAATTAVINVAMLVFMTCIAFGSSTGVLVSQSMGARNPDLAERYGWQSIKLIVLVMAAVGLTGVMFPEFYLRLFLPENPGESEVLKDMVIAVGAKSLAVCGIGAPIAAASLVLAQALYGAGEARFVMAVEFILHLTCLVPLAYFFAISLELGLLGCWLATGVYGIGLVSAMGFKFWRGSWKKTVI